MPVAAAALPAPAAAAALPAPAAAAALPALAAGRPVVAVARQEAPAADLPLYLGLSPPRVTPSHCCLGIAVV